MSEFEHLPEGATGTWEVTTSHGTRVYFDFDDALFQRIPAARPGREPNVFYNDGRWQRLGLWPIAWRKGEPSPGRPRVGWRVNYGLGVKDDYLSTEVVAIRPVNDDAAPPPNLPQIEFEDPAEVPDWAARPEDALCAYRMFGSWDSDGISCQAPTREAVLLSYASEFDEWLWDRIERGEDTRTIRWWTARLDERHSVLTWLGSHLAEPESPEL